MPFIFEREQPRSPEWKQKIDVIRQIYDVDEGAGLNELELLGSQVAREKGLRSLARNDFLYEIERVYRLPLSESLLIYNTFVGLSTESPCGRPRMMRDLKEKFWNWSRRRDVSEDDYWMFEVLVNQLSKEIPKLRCEGELSSVMGHISEMMVGNPEIRMRVLRMVIGLLRSSDVDDKNDALDVIENSFNTREVICIAAEYFRESEEHDTFFARSVIDRVSSKIREDLVGAFDLKDWNELDVEIYDSLRLLFQTLEGVWPTIRERGHDGIVLKSLKSLSETFPEVSGLMGRELRGKVGKTRKKREGGEEENEETRRFIYTTFGFLSELYGKSSDSQRARLDRYFGVERLNYDVVSMLRDLFESSETYGLEEDYYYANMRRGELSQVSRCLSKNSMILELMALMADDPKYRFQMGVLLSMMDYDDLPVRVKRRIAAVSCNSEQELKIKHSYWSLCDDAEPRMADAMYNGAVILVNDHLLVKFKGKMSAVCLRTFTTKKGFTFLEGNWYSPVDERTRNRIEEAYEKGMNKTEISGDSEWVLMRKLEGVGENTDEEFLAEIMRVLPTIESRKRKEFDTEGD